MRFVRRIFLGAGIYGLAVLTPMLFLEHRVGELAPPAITHPEYFYGFVGIALAWQVAFLIIAQDPARYRLLMIPAILEKISFGGAAFALWLAGRVSPQVLGPGSIDLFLAGLFALAYRRSGREG